MSRQSKTSASVCFASASACASGSFSCEMIGTFLTMHSTLGPVVVHAPSYTLDSVQLFLDQIIDFSMHCV